jgi:putative transcriptional regulator
MKILRDLRVSTELLILLEVIKNPHVKLRHIADALDITVQGASDYLRRMKKEGMIQDMGGELRATRKGIDFLHDHFSELRTFVEREMTKLNIIDVCAAIARTPVKEGDKVGLFMENGILTAYTGRKSPSTGIAASSSKVGEDVAIKELEGMVSLSPGTMYILTLPGIREGGSGSIPSGIVRDIYRKLKPDRTGIMGVVSIASARKSGIPVDLEFGALTASLEALEKGLSVLLLVSSDKLHEVVSAIENTNATMEDRINYEILHSKST